MFKQNIVFITGNQDKLKEVREILRDNFNVVNIKVDLQEIQSTDVKEVIEEKIKEANKILREKNKLSEIIDKFDKIHVSVKDFNDFTVICEDTGFHIDSMNIGENAETEPTKKFPGALIKFYLQALGAANIIKMNKDSDARLSCYIGIIKNGKIVNPIEGIVEGKVPKKFKSGTNGFGFDPCFIPNLSSDSSNNKYRNKTFAQLPSEIKNKISHRAVAFNNLKEYLLNDSGNLEKKYLKYKNKYINIKNIKNH